MTTLAVILFALGLAFVLWAFFTYWTNTRHAPGMGADIAFSQQWLLAALCFGCSALAHPDLHWGWAIGALVAFALLDIPVKMLASRIFERLQSKRPDA